MNPIIIGRTEPLWVLDKQALAEACKLLKIQWPVRVTRTSHRYRHGVHRIKENREAHYICIEKFATAEEANEHLWHELCHAMQCEQLGLKVWIRAAKTKSMRRELEREATAYEQCAQFMSLTKELDER